MSRDLAKPVRSALAWVIAAPWASAQRPMPCGIEALGTLTNPTDSSYPHAVSADGAVIVGRAPVGLTSRAFRWTRSLGMHRLDPLVAGNSSGALRVSGDGRVAVGFELAFGVTRAVRWVDAGAPEDLGSLGSGIAQIGDHEAVSFDGQVIVGSAYHSLGGRRAFRWTESAGMADLGTGGGVTSFAQAVSADGSVVVGGFYDASSRLHAFRWSEATGMVALPVPAGVTGAEATHVDADGDVIAGLGFIGIGQDRVALRWDSSGVSMPSGSNIPGSPVTVTGLSLDGEAMTFIRYGPAGGIAGFRWTAATGPIEITWQPGWGVSVNDLAADGGTVTGTVHSPSSEEFDRFAFRWEAATGIVLIGNLGGLSFGDAISADGSTIVGIASAPWTAAFRHVTHDVGQAYCLAGTHNGAGVTCYGDLFARGSAIVTQNDLVLVARALPAHAFGYFLASRTAGDSLPLGSVGRLCLGGATGRLTNAGVVLSSGPDGSFELVLDLNSIATPTGTVAVQPGETWHFQAWHRDSTESGAPTSNFTDASRVRFL